MKEEGYPSNRFLCIVIIVLTVFSFSACQTLEQCKTFDMQTALEKANNSRAYTQPIRVGDVIAIKYIGRFKDGTVFSRSPQGQALKLQVGKSNLVAGFENALIGMRLNEEKKFMLKAEDAYGAYNSKLKTKIPRKDVPDNVKVARGVVLSVSDVGGKKRAAVITDFNDKEVTLDFNHPLAGRDLYFDVKIVAIKKN